MSYEGYSQFLCKNGHQWTRDCNAVDEVNECLDCSEPPVWENMVDLTNGSFDGDERIDGYVELELLEPPKTCDKCNSVLEVRYKNPQKESTKP